MIHLETNTCRFVGVIHIVVYSSTHVRYGFDLFLVLSKGLQAPAENTEEVNSWIIVPHDDELIERQEV